MGTIKLSNIWIDNQSDKKLESILESSNKILDVLTGNKRIDELNLENEKFEYGEYYGIEYEPDSSPVAWKYYEIMSAGRFKFHCEKNSEITLNKRKKVYRIYSLFEYKKCSDCDEKFLQIDYGKLRDGVISIAGDCVFNFGSTYERYKEIIEHKELDFDKKNNLLFKLKLCAKMHHSPFNFSFMPVTGSLNTFKGFQRDGRFHFDRPDKFFYFIDKYYEFKNIEDKIFSYVRGNKSLIKKCLKDFLDTLGTINSFGYYLFFSKNSTNSEIVVDYIESWIENGQNDITNVTDIEKYMNMAIEFWIIQRNYYNKRMFFTQSTK